MAEPPPNLLEKPTQIGIAPWIAMCVRVRITNAPFGPVAELRELPTLSAHDVRQNFPATTGAVYRFSCLAKAGARHMLALAMGPAGVEDSGARAWFNLQTGEPTATQAAEGAPGALVEHLPGGWFRCSLIWRADRTLSGRCAALAQIGTEDATLAYTGTPTAGLFLAAPEVHQIPPHPAGLAPIGEQAAATAQPISRIWRDPPPITDLPDEDGSGPHVTSRATLAPIAVLHAPAFPVAPPDIVNPEIIHWGARHAMDQSWARGTFPPQPVQLYRLPGGIVSREGLVFDADLRVYAPTTHAFAPETIAQSRAEIAAALASGRLNHAKGATILCKRPASQNFGHYLVEMFTRAWIGARLLAGHEPAGRPAAIIVNRSAPQLMDVIYHSLRLTGIGLDRMLIMDDDPVRCDEVFFLNGLATHGTHMSPLAVGALDALSATTHPGQHRRLFVRRRSEMGRGLLNERALGQRLAEAGYTLVDPGLMSLPEQIALFRGAETVVGVLGAAMTNIAFCRPGTRVALIAPGSFPDTFFWFIATHKKLRYLEIRGDQVDEPDATTGNWDFSVRETDIETLAKL